MASSKNIFSGIRGLLLLAVCLAIIVSCAASKKYCGSELRQVLNLMCPNGVNGYKTKRSSLLTNEDYSSEIMENDDDFDFGFSLDMLTDMGNNGIAKLRRRRHGIVHECCDKPCSPSEVLSFCIKK